jgi:protein-L-isoaspartate(D-aspartate) O-methyltransferase
VLSKLAASVVALESDPDLASAAATTLATLGCDNVTVVTGPLHRGHEGAAPYDVILVGGSVEQTPEALLTQLSEGGRLVVVEGKGNAGRARVYLRNEGVVTGRNAFNAAIKSLPGFELTHAFEF